MLKVLAVPAPGGNRAPPSPFNFCFAYRVHRLPSRPFLMTSLTSRRNSSAVRPSCRSADTSFLKDSMTCLSTGTGVDVFI
jgi:hypothetical protein